MRYEKFWLWLLIALLILGMIFTLLWGRRGSRHGYGTLVPAERQAVAGLTTHDS